MNQEDIDIRLLGFEGDNYPESLILRNEVLRKPLGMRLSDEDLSKEIDDYHVGAFINGILTGILILTPKDNGQIQMRQVAVAEKARGLHIGRQMVAFSEEFARKKGFSKMILHARETAVDFYLRNGYDIEGEMFEEVSIPHFRMSRNL